MRKMKELFQFYFLGKMKKGDGSVREVSPRTHDIFAKALYI
jgi:hypothetical protein